MQHEFRLFPGDKEPSPGDAVIQFLIEEQKKGTERFKNVMESVFPGFGKAIEKTTSGSEERKKKLNELFGLELGKPITSEDITELALGFGVGSIKGITGVPGRITLSGKKVPNKDPEGLLFGPKARVELREKVEKTGQNLQPIDFPTRVKPGTKPSSEFLEAQALNVTAKKATQAKVKQIQKDLQALAIEEVIPDAPPNLVRGLAQKGLRPRVESQEGEMLINFESASNATHPEFTLRNTPEALILEVNYNSELVTAKMADVYGANFKTKFIDETFESPTVPAQMQRILTGTSEGARKPKHFAEFLVNDFGDGLQTITKMMELIDAR